MQDERPDFLVVGSGAGGGPLACNLARRGFRVLVLEAGGWDEPEVSQVPAFHAHASEDPSISWEFFVQHYEKPSAPDSKLDREHGGLFYPRTATVGGCTQHNAMITLAGPSDDWDEIAGLTGDASWSRDRMRGYFERLERCGYARAPGTGRFGHLRRALDALRRRVGLPPVRNPGRHGFEGWLSTTVADPKLAVGDERLLRELFAAFKASKAAELFDLKRFLRDAALDDLGATLDPNHWGRLSARPEGLALVPIAVRDGTRCGPRAYLRETLEACPDELRVQPHTLVTEVIFDERSGGPPRAIGVRARVGRDLYAAHPRRGDGPGAEVEIFCRREVILCGGAFNTPQLLMLSGIGERRELERHGIRPRVELRGVGRNLQDRYEVGVIQELEHDFRLLEGLAFGPPEPGREPDAALAEWHARKTGLYTTNGAVLAILKKSRPDLAAPDLCIFGLPGSFRGYYRGYAKDVAVQRNRITWAVLKAYTQNRGGYVKLRSKDPLERPEINFRYFGEGSDVAGEDLDAMVEGVKFVRSFRRDGGREVLPGEGVRTDAEIRAFVEREAWGHHASCTCPIGADGDPMAVLDARFRVRGARALRVVDASAFPRIPGIFIVTNVYMISEKASDVVAEEHAG